MRCLEVHCSWVKNQIRSEEASTSTRPFQEIFLNFTFGIMHCKDLKLKQLAIVSHMAMGMLFFGSEKNSSCTMSAKNPLKTSNCFVVKKRKHSFFQRGCHALQQLACAMLMVDTFIHQRVNQRTRHWSMKFQNMINLVEVPQDISSG